MLQSVIKTNRSMFDNIFMVLYMQMKYLQEEHAILIVQGLCDPTISLFFHSLQ